MHPIHDRGVRAASSPAWTAEEVLATASATLTLAGSAENVR
jgi:hypothetical protein